ncbi:N-lysine methyltransferase protein [Nymphaea thermarum]|nr:N-lysine methyltransferase protein [Nymphaea thermarum]
MADRDEKAATVGTDLGLALLKINDDSDDERERAETYSEGEDEAHNEKNQAQQQQQYLLKSIQSSILIRQLPSEGLSFQLWPAATALVSLMDQKHPPIPCVDKLKAASNVDRPIRALELGSGTGLVGIAAAALLGAQVVLTDLPHVLPNLLFNAEANREVVRASGRGGSVSVDCLRWGNAEDCLKHCGLDLILASDVVYHSHLFDPLLQTLRLLLVEETVLVMAHLRRWKKDAVFFKKAKKWFDVEMVHTHPPFPGTRVGVAIYCFTKRA